MSFFTLIFCTTITLILNKFIYQIANFFIAPYRSPLRFLPGPPSKNWYLGWTTSDVIKDMTHVIQRKHEEYGPVYYGMQVHRVSTLYIIDEDAINFIFQNEFSTLKNNSELFRRIPFLVKASAFFFGSTLLGVEDDVHKRQRKAMLPAFTDSSIRQSSSVMYEVVETLMEVLQKDVKEGKKGGSEYTQVIISNYTKEVAMDTIGQAAFGHDLGALKKQANTLNEAFLGLISMIISPSYYALTRFRIPWIGFLGKYFMKEEKQLRKYKDEIDDYADMLIEKAKNEAKEQGKGQDNILRLIKRASPSSDANSMSEKQNTISDEELREGVPILLLAGYETTAASLTWAFFDLTKDEEGLKRQALLRSELKQEENQGWQNDLTILNKLPYLDAICAEILRLHPVLSILQRMCWKDTVIPLASPVTLRDGSTTKQIPIKEGEFIYMSVTSMNTSKSLWGENSKQFIPERWLREGHPLFDPTISQLTERARQVGGWNHIMTFGQGIRMCLGFRFALAEFKIVLANCIDKFEWKAAIDPKTGKQFIIESRGQSISKPALKGAKTGDYTLPMLAKVLDQ